MMRLAHSGRQYVAIARHLARGIDVATWGMCGALVVVLTGGLLVSSHLHLAIAEKYAEELGAGGNVLVIRAENSGISRTDCSALNARSDVLNAGSVRHAEVDRISSAPGVGLAVAEVDLAYLRVVAPQLRGDLYEAGVVLGSSAAFEVGAGPGVPVAWLSGRPETQVLATPDLSTRAPEMDRTAFMVVASEGAADECWIEAVPGLRAELEAQAATLIDPTVSPTIRSVRPSPPEDTIDSTLLSLWQWLPLVAALGCAGVGLAEWVHGRSRMALLRVCGMSPAEIALVRSVISTVLFLLVSTVAVTTAGVVSWLNGSMLAAQSFSVVLVGGAAYLMTTVLTSFARQRNTLTALKDR